jgi:hypothetical protein
MTVGLLLWCLDVKVQKMREIRWWLAVVAVLLLVAGCGGDGSAERSVVVVTPDEVAEIVIIDEIEDEIVEAPVVEAAPTTVVVEGGGDEEEGAVVLDGGVEEVVSVKQTVPLAPTEDDTPLEGLVDSLGEFIDCMLLNGFDLGDPTDPSFTQKMMDGALNDPAFASAGEECEKTSGMGEAQEELMESGSDLTPEQIREGNEMTVLLFDCMDGRGWQMELLPDENGLLMPDEDNMTPPANVNPSNVMTVLMEDIKVCGEQLAEDQLGQTGN